MSLTFQYTGLDRFDQRWIDSNDDDLDAYVTTGPTIVTREDRANSYTYARGTAI